MIQFLEYLAFLYLFSYYETFFFKYIVSYFTFLFFEKIQKKILQKYFHFSFSAGMDLIFDLESNQNQSTIVTCGILEKPLSEEIIDKIRDKIEKESEYYRLQEILHKNWFFSYWKRDSKYNILNHIIRRDIHIKNEKEIYKIMGDELSKPFSNDKPKWFFAYYKNYSNNKSFCLMKFHHTLVDGISLMAFFLNISNAQNLQIVHFPKPSLFSWIYSYLSLPIAIPYYVFKYVLRKADHNKIHGFELSGNKKVFSLEAKHTVEELKIVSKRLRVSINDLFTSSLIECLHQYCQENFNEDLKNICMFMPISMRGFPEKGKLLPLNNWMIPIFIDLKIYCDNNKEIVAKKYGNVLLNLKNSLEAPALFLLTHYAPKFLPTIGFKIFMDHVSFRPTFGFTNVPGPLNKILMYDVAIEKMFFYVPTVNSIGLGFSLMTYNNMFFVGIQTDDNTKIDPEKFALMYEKILEEYLTQANKNNYVSPTQIKKRN